MRQRIAVKHKKVLGIRLNDQEHSILAGYADACRVKVATAARWILQDWMKKAERNRKRANA
jgi:hypothetical protein